MPEHQQIQQSKKPDTIFQKQATHVSQTPVSNPFSIIQRARINPKSLTHADVMQLQRTIGNRAVGRLLSGIGNPSTARNNQVIQGWFNSIDNVPPNLRPTTRTYAGSEILAIANWIQEYNNNSTAIRGRLENFNITPQNHHDKPYTWSVAYHMDLTNHSHGGVDTPHTHVSTHVDDIGNTIYTVPSQNVPVTNGPNLGPVFGTWLECSFAMNQGELHPTTVSNLKSLIQTWTDNNASRFDPEIDSESESDNEEPLFRGLF